MLFLVNTQNLKKIFKRSSFFRLKKKKVMIFNPHRESLHASSMKCQTLLGKAMQEHFVTFDFIAVIFSSSATLRNSSFGANFLLNSCLSKTTINLFKIVFTPEDCSSLQFIHQLTISGAYAWTDIFAFLRRFIRDTRYLVQSLRSLNFWCQWNSGANVSVITDELFFFVSHLHNLRTLQLTKCDKLRNDGIKLVCENLPFLTNLDLSGIYLLSEDGMKHVATLNFLERLNLADCENVNDRCLNCISSLTRLKYLNLSNCFFVSDTGISFLVPLIHLETLILTKVEELTDACLVESLSQLPHLTELNLSECRFTDVGLEHLKKEFYALRQLDISYCEDLSEEGKAELKKALPNCKIVD
jgi:hypothetical protein